MSKIKEMLEKVGKDVLSAETKTVLAEAFDTAVNELVTERVKLEVDSALQKLDEDHTQKLIKLLEAVDLDHTEKLKKVVAKIDEDHAGKLQSVVGKYEGMLKEEAVKFRDALVSEVSNYMDLYLDKTVPARQIAEACEATAAKRMISDIKKIVSVDESFINDNIKEALEDGKQQIDTLRGELNEAIKENVKLNQDIKSAKTELMLEQKTIAFPKEKKDYVMRVLKDKSPDYITENFDYAVEMFVRDEKDAVSIITEQAKKETATSKVDTPPVQIKETVDPETEEAPVNEYLSELKRQDRR